jgi:hypothetical protein
MKLGLYLGYSGARMSLPVERVELAERLGYDSVWTAEAYGSDAITPLAYLAAVTRRIRLGTGIMQLAARTPAAAAILDDARRVGGHDQVGERPRLVRGVPGPGRTQDAESLAGELAQPDRARPDRPQVGQGRLGQRMGGRQSGAVGNAELHRPRSTRSSPASSRSPAATDRGRIRSCISHTFASARNRRRWRPACSTNSWKYTGSFTGARSSWNRVAGLWSSSERSSSLSGRAASLVMDSARNPARARACSICAPGSPMPSR